MTKAAKSQTKRPAPKTASKATTAKKPAKKAAGAERPAPKKAVAKAAPSASVATKVKPEAGVKPSEAPWNSGLEAWQGATTGVATAYLDAGQTAAMTALELGRRNFELQQFMVTKGIEAARALSA